MGIWQGIADYFERLFRHKWPVKVTAVLIFVFGLSWHEVLAADTDPYEALVAFSTITSKQVDQNNCKISGVMDFDKFGSSLSVFREAWLNRDYSLDYYNMRRKQLFVGIIAKRYAELLTEGLYNSPDPPKLDHCFFDIRIKSADKYGQDQIQKGLSWEFSTQVASKMNWKQFNPRDFKNVALNYKIDDEITAWISDEPGADGVGSTPKHDNSNSCNEDYAKANAIFIRAASFCKKDYLDTKAGYLALDEAKKCAQQMSEQQQMDFSKNSMLQLDAVVKAKGRTQACEWVESIEQDVLNASKPN